MAFIPFLVIGPSAIMGLIGLLKGPDKTVPTPREDWKTATVDLLIPSYNEEKNIILCLDSVLNQTIQPRTIYLIDDASKDNTVEYAELYAKSKNINLHIVKRQKNEGKTPSIAHVLSVSDAEIVAILDADTILRSPNYLERLVKEVYEGVGIACACGVILPMREKDRKIALDSPDVLEFTNEHPSLRAPLDKSLWHRMQRGLTNGYREELYLYLQRFIYRGEMIFFGTIIFPIGCACVHKREYLKLIMDYYHQYFGYDLTTSEDIFFGFAYATEGYRNIVVQDVYALTTEPRFLKMFPQVMKWTSSFLQSCYYFDDLFLTPFKALRYFKKRRRDKKDPEVQKNLEKRVIQEAYRQPFGSAYTGKYGRNIGWFVFTATVEKICYPVVMLILLIFQQWEPVILIIIAETLIYALVITYMQKNRKMRNFIKTILFSPIRYMQLVFDLFIVSKFIIDLWVTRNRKWRK